MLTIKMKKDLNPKNLERKLFKNLIQIIFLNQVFKCLEFE